MRGYGMKLLKWLTIPVFVMCINASTTFSNSYFKIEIYPDSAGSKPCPDTIADTAGAKIHLILKLFDAPDHEYLTNNVPVVWSSSNAIPNALIQTGNSITYTVGYSADHLIAQCDLNDNITLIDTIHIVVKPDTNYHLSVEADSTFETNSTNVAPIIELAMSGSRTENYVFYPILRDRFGNWVKRSNNTICKITDTAIAVVSTPHNTITVTPKAAEGTPLIIATDTSYNTSGTFWVTRIIDSFPVAILAGKDIAPSNAYSKNHAPENVFITIYNSLGRKVLERNETTSLSKLPVSDFNLPKGLYYLKIRGKNVSVSKKIIINR
jgi:hypothetical protein